jgi:peptide-methionine (S)-S-oxide reductase
MRPFLVAAAALGLTFGIGLATALPAAEAMVRAPAPAVDLPNRAAASETAVFAGGCFWGVQGVFAHVKGVTSAVSGYTGGGAQDARYPRVSDGNTGHAEAVRVTFDPRVVSYGQLLRIYFSVVADPTQLNRQGPDEGTQYRSALFPVSERQRRVAAAYIAQLGRAKLWPRPIVTRLERAQGFYPAEAYHQDYLFRHPDAFYIRVNDQPKVARLKAWYPQHWRDRPVLVNG